jgi:Flp pilus assembly protein TadD
MNYSLLPFFLIILSIAVVIVIITRKFPQLSVLNLDTIPEVKEGKKKDEMLRKRAKEEVAKTSKKRVDMESFISKLSLWWSALQRRLREFVQLIYDKIQEEKMKDIEKKSVRKKSTDIDQKKETDNKKISRDLFNQGEYAFKEGDLETAEKRFISIIRMDAKNVDAYEMLGRVYLEQKHLEEAKQTFEFLLQLKPDSYDGYIYLATIAEEERQLSVAVEYYQQAVLLADDKPDIYMRLASILTELDQYDTARIAMREAVEIQPNNPRYLDTLIELDVVCGEREDAYRHLDALRMVNPDNKKIPLLKEKIDSMDDPDEVIGSE